MMSKKFLDINASFQLTEKVRLFAEAKNLTNQPLRYYQGIKAKTMQLEYYDLSWNVGLKFDFLDEIQAWSCCSCHNRFNS